MREEEREAPDLGPPKIVESMIWGSKEGRKEGGGKGSRERRAGERREEGRE